MCVATRQYINTSCVFTVHAQSFFLFLSLKASSSSSSLFKTQTLSCIFTATCVNHQCWLYSFSCPPRLSRVEEIWGLPCTMLFSERPNCRTEVGFLFVHVCVVRDGIEHDMRAAQAEEKCSWEDLEPCGNHICLPLQVPLVRSDPKNKSILIHI